MDWKKTGKKLLYPNIALMLILFPAAAVLLIYSMVFVGTETMIAYISYVFAAYTLTVWCFRIPWLIRFIKSFKDENRYVQIWLSDTRLRVNVSLHGSFLWNTAYAVFQLGLGFWHHTFWFYSLAGYYICLAVMRFFLVRHTRKHNAGEKIREELIKYRNCGIAFLLMNLALSLIVFFMVYWNRTFEHNEITTIAMAAYTFGSMTMAIINAVKYRKYNSPVYSASKAISLAAASVSMLTLEASMLTTFSDDTMTLTKRRMMLGATGAVICIFIIIMAIYMIVQGSKKLTLFKTEGNIDE